jgi:hypothetical protein
METMSCNWCGKPFVEDERPIKADPFVSDDLMHPDCVARAESGHLPPSVVRALAEAAQPPAWSFTTLPSTLDALRAYADGDEWTDPAFQASFIAKHRDPT